MIMSKRTGGQGARNALLELVFRASFQRGSFMLSSGRESSFYLDGKQTTLSPEGSLLIAEILLEEAVNSEVDSIGGLAIGADPIIGSVLTLGAIRGIPIRGFIVRKEGRKKHGTQSLIEGPIKRHDRVIIIDDVITTGGSALKAVEAVEELQCKVIKVISLIDRNQGGKERFESRGYDYQPIITIDEIFRFEKSLQEDGKTPGRPSPGHF